LLASYLLATYQVRGEPSSFAEPIDMVFDLSPDDAIKYFKKKRVVTTTQFNSLAEDARSAAFTVGGVYKKDVLEGFKSEIVGALEKGTAQGKVVQRFKDILAGAGHRELGDFHLETVFRTNMNMAYGVGRRRGLEAVAEDLPYWTYHSVGDDRVRPTHAVLNGLTLPASHEFWATHYPPWGFNCRCSVTASEEPAAGYDHANPSGEGTIYYDRRGMPAKAEIGTSVYDLAVGDFRGVPPQGGLKEVIEAGVKRSAKAPEKGTALGIPISQAFEIMGAPRFHPRAQRVLRAIDKVHGDGDLPKIPLMRRRFVAKEEKGALGVYLSTHPGGKPIGVFVNTSTREIELTAAHEIGHFLDQQGIGTRGVFSSGSDNLLSDWRNAVERSRAIQFLLEMREQQFIPAILNGERVLVQAPMRLLNYMLDPSEVWARSYAQYITNASGDKFLKTQLDKTRQRTPGRLYLPHHWDDEDFRGIGSEIESLMKRLGWKK
jgi:SPP1 gp7 family putative phage head morphogenesis protein